VRFANTGVNTEHIYSRNFSFACRSDTLNLPNMDAAFKGVAFTQPESAETTLAAVSHMLPPQLWAALPGLLAQLPDPDGALNYLERYFQTRSGAGGEASAADVMRFLGQRPAALHHLLVIFSYSRFLSETLIQQPEMILWLDRVSLDRGFVRMDRTGVSGSGVAGSGSLDRIKSPEDLHAEFARFAATSFELSPSVILARFKRREYIRITLRDVLGLATLGETTLELSHLADVLLENALRLAEQKLEAAYGTPETVDESGVRQRTRLTIISLGKLGGFELNYSSDVDLMFMYGGEGNTSGGLEGATTNADYFARLAQGILKTIMEMTPEGAVFRVDLRLRPQGSEGALATPVASALDYYRTNAREWELQMLIKARGSAGDISIAKRFLAEMQPLIYRPEFNLAAVEAVLDAREEISKGLRKRAITKPHAAEWNVKLSLGGIRDIEFLTQCLQRLYGGAEAWLHSGTTLVALQRLHDKGYVSGREFFRLAESYQFLRKVEHRLQLRNGLQRHTLPHAAEALDRLARRCGVEAGPDAKRTPGEELVHRIAKCFADVREIYDRVLATRKPAAVEPTEHFEADAGAGQLLRRLQSTHPAIAEVYAKFAEGKNLPVRRGLTRYLSSAMLSPDLVAELTEHPEWLASAAEICGASDYAVEWLARHPGDIHILTETERARPSSIVDRDSLLREGSETAMSYVRVRYRQRVFAALVDAIRGPRQPFETFGELSSLAEKAICETLEIAAHDVLPAAEAAQFAGQWPGGGETLPIAVLALGRLGTSEMDFASDVDLVFIADSALDSSEREPWRKIMERFSNLAASLTRDGILFPVDTRLRPRGTEGEIVQSSAYVLDYFRTEAAAWEAATYLKARAVAGNLRLGRNVIASIQSICRERFADEPFAATELARTRERLDTEGTTWEQGRPPRAEFKKVAGGFYDIEYILAFHFLTRGLARGVTPGGHVLRQIAALESAGEAASGLTTSAAGTLRAGALLFRAADHAIRIVTGHAAKGDPEPSLVERISPLLQRWGGNLRGGVGEDLAAMRKQMRKLYVETVVARRKSA
jgi:[glutamine synthetase] adenylyltransferase / [glutamine synthetase]-adenylyl-L-tyrosine phosphorylase